MVRRNPNQTAFRFPGARPTLADELIIDIFAGGGGASHGIEIALGRSPDYAINHDEAAITMHTANHPSTIHLKEDVWKVKIGELVAGRRVGLLWASPDCRHFSRAKGGKPVSKSVRSLAWVVVEYAKEVAPRVICLENVPEFLDWGPIHEEHAKGCIGGTPKLDGRGDVRKENTLDLHPCSKNCQYLNPIKERKGEEFIEWAEALRALGYEVEWKILTGADFGAPTSRKRIFLVARNDGCAIVWPERSHGKGTPYAYRTAAECIDWLIPCPSIFRRKRNLADATLRRVARGIIRYVIEDANPFLVQVNHSGPGFRGQPMDRPMPTVSKKHGFGLVSPIIAGCGGRAGQSEPRPANGQMYTITKKADTALVTPHLSQFYGASTGQRMDKPAPTASKEIHSAIVAAVVTKFQENGVGQKPDKPIQTVMAGAPRFGLVNAQLSPALTAAAIMTNNTGHPGQSVEKPLATKTTTQHHALIAGTLVQTGYGERKGQRARYLNIRKPLGTTPGTAKHAACYCILKHYGGVVGQPVERSLGTITKVDHHSLVEAKVTAPHITKLYGTATGADVRKPMPTSTSGGQHLGLVAPVLLHYYGQGGQDQKVNAPIHTIPTKHRHALAQVDLSDDLPGAVTVARFMKKYGDYTARTYIRLGNRYRPVIMVKIGEAFYLLTDIGLRMLQPRELATAQGFPLDYQLTGTKSEQVAKIGNSVVPQVAAAVVRANLGETVQPMTATA